VLFVGMKEVCPDGTMVTSLYQGKCKIELQALINRFIFCWVEIGKAYGSVTGEA